MAYKDFVTGAVLSEADLDMLMKQSVITCTSGTRPSSPLHGMRIYETDTFLERVWNSSASSWVVMGSSGVFGVSPSLTATTTDPDLGASYAREGWYARGPANLITYNFYIRFGTSGVTAGSGQYRIGLPSPVVNSLAGGAMEAQGTGILRDSSAGEVALVHWYTSSSDPGYLFGYSLNPSATATSTVNNSWPWTWAVNDYLSGMITYRAAS